MEKTFGTWLKNRRGTLSQSAFASRIGVDVKTLRNAENHDVLVTTAVRICRGLGLSFSEVMHFWQDTPLEVAAQYGEERWQGALTAQDVQRWLLRLLEGHQRNQELLVAALNLIVLRSGVQATPVPQMTHLFHKEDIQKMLWDFSWFRYDVMPPLNMPVIADMLSIYQHGGLLLPSEIGAYINFVRRQKDISLATVSATTGIDINKIGSIENGLIKHVKLSELLRLDDCLQRGGEILSLYWWEIANRHALEQEWATLDCMNALTPRLKHALVSMLISVGRWLQVIYQDDTEWHAAIRYALGLYTPGCTVAA